MEKMVVYNVKSRDKAKIDKFMAKLNYKLINEPLFTYYNSTSY